MDITVQYYLGLISKIPNKNYWKTKKYIKKLMEEVYSYRSTAYLEKGKNISDICNYYANQIEYQLKKILGE